MRFIYSVNLGSVPIHRICFANPEGCLKSMRKIVTNHVGSLRIPVAPSGLRRVETVHYWRYYLKLLFFFADRIVAEEWRRGVDRGIVHRGLVQPLPGAVVGIVDKSNPEKTGVTGLVRRQLP